MKVTLGSVASYINGFAFKPTDWSTCGLKIVRIQNLTNPTSEANYYNGTYDLKYEVNRGDILISWSASLGIYIWQDEKAVLNQHIFKVVFDKIPINKKYFFYQVSYILERAKSETHGATMKHLTRPVFNALPFELPSMKQQNFIANELDIIARLINTHKRQLHLLDELIKSRFVETFGDPMTNSHNLPKVILKSVLTIKPQNGLYKPQSDYVSDKAGVPILRIDSFYNGKVTNHSVLKRLICSKTDLKRYLLHEKDIVINRVNSIEYLGKCGLIQGLVEDTVFESNMMRLHVDERKFHPVYITKLLCSKFIYQQILKRAKKAVNQASINQKDVESFVVYMPPLEQQINFATFVSQIDKSRLAIQKSLNETQLLFDSLMQKYFG